MVLTRRLIQPSTRALSKHPGFVEAVTPSTLSLRDEVEEGPHQVTASKLPNMGFEPRSPRPRLMQTLLSSFQRAYVHGARYVLTVCNLEGAQGVPRDTDTLLRGLSRSQRKHFHSRGSPSQRGRPSCAQWSFGLSREQ